MPVFAHIRCLVGGCCRERAERSNYCARHGGAKAGTNRPVSLWGLPMFFRNIVRGSVAEFVEASLAEAPSRQISLLEELALMRASAANAVSNFSTAQAAYEANPSSAQAAEMIHLATMDMREALHEIRTMVQACAELDRKAADKFSVHNLQYIIAEITQCAHIAFGEDKAKAEEFTRLINSKVKLIEQNGGTTIKPSDIDDEVRAMDASVPFTDLPLPESNPIVNAVE